MFDGCDAVCNLATHIPVGLAALRSRAWRENDRLRTEGVRRVVDAAQEARVRRLVQESVSFLYADDGDGWIAEDSPLDINPATEPASVGESHAQGYRSEVRHSVVLRFGTIVGDDDLTRWQLRTARSGLPVGVGTPAGWAHLVHTDDLGSAVAAALCAPSGTYNVGAEPTRREDLVAGLRRGGRTPYDVHASRPAAAGRLPARAAHPVAARELGTFHGTDRLDPTTGPLRPVVVRRRRSGGTRMPVREPSPEEQEAARRRRLAEVFGEALPEATATTGPTRRSGPRGPRTTGSARRSPRTTADLSTPYD